MVYPLQHNLLILLDEIKKDGFPYVIDEYGFVLMVQLPHGRNRVFYNADYGLDNSTLRRIFEDKIYTSKLLRQGGFKVADDMLVTRNRFNYSNGQTGLQACLQFADQHGYPLIFKPNDGSLWTGVIKIFNQQQLLEVLENYYQWWKRHYLLQTFLRGKDYRVIYLDGEILAAYERIPPQLIGDGDSCLQDLLEQKFQHLNTKKVYHYLAQQEIFPETILDKGQKIWLLPTANIATGGVVREVEFTERDRVFLESIAHYFWARYLGIDILTEGALADGFVLEINKSPITKGIWAASAAFRENYPAKIRSAIKKQEGL